MKKHHIINIVLSAAAGVLAFFYGPKVFGSLNDGDLNWAYLLVALPMYMVADAINLDPETIKRKRNEKASKLYTAGILPEKIFFENNLPIIFTGLTRINLVLCDKIAACAHHCRTIEFMNNKTNTATVKEQTVHEIETYFDVVAGIDNKYPTFVFVNVGMSDIAHGIGRHLRMLKEKNPDITILIACSNFYEERKADTIHWLIEDGIAEPFKISDNIFDNHTHKLIREIQACLQEEKK